MGVWNLGDINIDDSVGGEAFVAYSASMMFPVPNAPITWPLRLQAYVNAGALLPLNRGISRECTESGNIQATFSELLNRPSIGVGVGMIYRTPIGRVELNFGVPVTMRQGDWPRKGFQFGIGVDFM
jgi:outer membrane protein insertion porin family